MTAAFTRKLGRFTRLSSRDVATLARLCERHRHLGVREDIIREGQKPVFINVVQEGWACRYKVLEDGRRQILSLFLPGDMCDMNVFILREMDHSVAAITPVVLSEIARAAFDEVMSTHPRLAQALWWDSLVSTAIQREWTVNIGQRAAFERIAHLFCEIYVRLQAAGLTKADSCDMPLTQADLGEATGLSVVHINRTLQELRSAGLIVLKDRVLTIPNLHALQQAAMFNANYLHLDFEGRTLDANDG